ncbi:hypothetical protein GYM54_07965 [Pseudomonas sp. MTM4]|uniref:hypothetical protein n=1 Tax=unclassified Pseudomonas TaxID=196821 RepID=UPI0018D26B8C|nr:MULTISPECIES: hypothetical protein [unclassified Pseudomonas]MBC8650700.1 hypothetical protein [Pseudomonas sp. MT4]QXY91533.1 hypothetical protein GYM54_07965 [Pseudomonas sp. MTM4]
MRSDWDDAPEYLRSRKKQGPWLFLAILGFGSAVITALALTFGKPIVLDMSMIKQSIHVGGKPWFNQEPAQAMQPASQQTSIASYEAPAVAPSPAPEQRQLSQEEIDRFDKRTSEAQSRQTSFNDDNYTPRPIANTMQPPPARYYAASSSSNTHKRPVSRQPHLSPWSWGNGHNKQRVGGRFAWTVVNGQIDYNSVCQNYKRGSLIYRDCRKGAKVAFKQMCDQYQPACAAENNFMP